MAITNGCRSSSPKSPECRRDKGSWETRFGLCTAFSLTILEVKRLILLIFELFVDSRPIRFAGALLPIIFSFLDIGLSFPVALGALYAIRKYAYTYFITRHKMNPYCPKMKRTMRRIVFILVICIIMNVVTIILIFHYVDGSKDSQQDTFKNAMRFYSKNSRYKQTIDELQYDLRCCGYTSYIDWFTFNWQGIDYVDVEGREEFGVRSIPYSCCNTLTMLPCFHVEMKDVDVKTINSRGCAVILNGIIFKIIAFGYAMTAIIIFTQIFLVIFITKILKKMTSGSCSSLCSCSDSTCQSSESVSLCSLDKCEHQCFMDDGHEHRSRMTVLVKPLKSSECRHILRKPCCQSISSSSSSSSLSSSSHSSDSTFSSSAQPISSPSPSKTCKGRKRGY